MARLKQIKPNYALGAAAEELGRPANQAFVGEYLAGTVTGIPESRASPKTSGFS